MRAHCKRQSPSIAIDAEGTLRLIIHHSDIDRGEPFTIWEEWIDR